VPFEVIATTADRVDAASSAVLVPESSAVVHRAVVSASLVHGAAAAPWIVVSVVRGEPHSVVVAECIAADVTRVARHVKLVVS